jgi:hypothetical protein
MLQLEEKDPENEKYLANIPPIPNEILLKIFSYVSTCDLLLNVAKVSKRFHQLTYHPSVHIVVTLLDSVDQNPALRFFEENNCIEEVNIFTGKYDPHLIHLGSHLLIKSLWNQKCLRVINLETRMHVDEDHLVYLLQQPNAKKLKKIKIMKFWCEQMLPYPNFDYISRYPYPIGDFDWVCHANNLSHLDLGYTSESFGVNFNTLMNIGKVSKQLVSLIITGNFSYNRLNPILNVTSILRANQNSLKEFRLSNYQCLEEDVSTLIQCDNLESLCFELSYQNISRQDFYLIIQNKQLKNLHLRMMPGHFKTINVYDLAHLLRQPNLANLTSLRLSVSDGKNYNHILKAIASLKNLKELYVLPYIYIYIRVETHKGLFAILNGCKNLEKLILWVTLKFDKDKFKKIFTMNLPNLRVLGLHHYGQNIDVDSKFVMNCLYTSKSIKIVRLDTVLYYKQDLKSDNLLTIDGYENFREKFPDVAAEVVKAFDFKNFLIQVVQEIFRKGVIYENINIH